MNAAELTHEILQRLGVASGTYRDGELPVTSPLTGAEIARVQTQTATEAAQTVARARRAFETWREVPAPRRGELIRLFGEELRAAKDDLGRLVSLEVGKIPSEGAGEVQEMIDICDFALGLSRQLYGLTIATERPGHRMMEQWHPLGVVGVITAFNFPVAVFSWNAALALVCGDPVIWKPSEKSPLTALATMAILQRALARFGDAPADLAALLIGGPELGDALVAHRDVALVSATSSTTWPRSWSITAGAISPISAPAPRAADPPPRRTGLSGFPSRDGHGTVLDPFLSRDGREEFRLRCGLRFVL